MDWCPSAILPHHAVTTRVAVCVWTAPAMIVTFRFVPGVTFTLVVILYDA
jgi:hypothetical protein